MASLWEKAIHVQILISMVIRKDSAHKRYKKNVSEDRATLKPGDTKRLTKSSYPVSSELSDQSGKDSSLLCNRPMCSRLSVRRGMGSTVPGNLSACLLNA